MPAQDVLRAAEDAFDQLLHRGRMPFADQGAGPEPRHVEQIADQPVEALRLLPDRLEQVATFPVREHRLGVEEAGHRCGDRGERGPEIVGDRLQE